MRRGGLIAIVTVRELSRFIGDLAVAEGVAGALTPFILYGDDRVLAHPALADGAGGLGLSVDRVLPTPADLGDEALAALAEGLWTRAEVQNPGIESRIVDLEGGERIVLTRGLDGYADRPVTLGVHASTAELGAEFFRLMRAGAIGVALLVVAVVVGVLVGRRIARPVQQLAPRPRRWRVWTSPRRRRCRSAGCASWRTRRARSTPCWPGWRGSRPMCRRPWSSA